MSQIRIALCGIGGYARLYTNYILDQNDPRITPVGVVEPFPESCPRLTELQEAGIPVYETLDDLYREHHPDLTVIATPIQCHTPQILTALANGSHVLCEKPLCADAGDVEKLRQASRAAGRFVFIGYQWSYSDAVLGLKKDILSGRFGRCLDMKSIVLWPRDLAYYRRGCGWAGKITLEDGTPVYDSIANNATAHYLHNMLFLLGEDGHAAVPESIRGELLRANAIENFDTCKIDLTMPGSAEVHFLASHAVDTVMNPVFHFRFEKADVYYAQNDSPLARSILPEVYTQFGQITAVLPDGTHVCYGNPFANDLAKLERAIDAACRGDLREYPCGIEAASAHTGVITWLQQNETVWNIAEAKLVRTPEKVFVPGLGETMLECFRHPELSLSDWREE